MCQGAPHQSAEALRIILYFRNLLISPMPLSDSDNDGNAKSHGRPLPAASRVTLRCSVGECLVGIVWPLHFPPVHVILSLLKHARESRTLYLPCFTAVTSNLCLLRNGGPPECRIITSICGKVHTHLRTHVPVLVLAAEVILNRLLYTLALLIVLDILDRTCLVIRGIAPILCRTVLRLAGVQMSPTCRNEWTT